MKKFIESIKWRNASTYEKTAPHEYVMRQWLSDEDKIKFDKFARVIKLFGYKQYFYSRLDPYYNIGQYKYWHLGKVGTEDQVINRAIIGNIYGTNNTPDMKFENKPFNRKVWEQDL